jgi:hypothetical protein
VLGDCARRSPRHATATEIAEAGADESRGDRAA